MIQYFLRQDNLWTSAGVSAAIDLCLAYVENGCGPERRTGARNLPTTARRPIPFSGELAVNVSSSKVINETQAWVLSNLKNKISMEALADRCSMSVRSFRRQFHKETGQCPTEYIEKARPDRVLVVLCDSTLPIKSIAYQCGFPSDDQMRAAFRKYLAITPKNTASASCAMPKLSESHYE